MATIYRQLQSILMSKLKKLRVSNHEFELHTWVVKECRAALHVIELDIGIVSINRRMARSRFTVEVPVSALAVGNKIIPRKIVDVLLGCEDESVFVGIGEGNLSEELRSIGERGRETGSTGLETKGGMAQGDGWICHWLGGYLYCRFEARSPGSHHCRYERQHVLLLLGGMKL